MAEERRSPGTGRPLEATIIALAARVAFPEDIDVAAAVARRLRAERGKTAGRVIPFRRRTIDRPALRPVFRPAWQKTAVAAAAVVVLATGALAASPGARQAVANFLGLRGIRIKIVPSLSPVPSPSLGSGFSLGDPMTLAQAQARVPFRIGVPTASGLGSPDEVYVLESSSGAEVSLLYRARPGLPVASTTGAGLLVSQFQGRLDRPLLGKAVGEGAVIRGVTVNGHPGFWIEGQPHELFFLDRGGRPIPETVRLAGNVLVWQQGDVLIRSESALPLDRALRIAQSVG